MQRGAHFLNSTTGYNILNLSDTTSTTRANVINLNNSANTTTYATFGAGAHTIGNIDGPISMVRTSGATAGTRPVQFVRNTTTASTTPATGDGASYRLQAAGSDGVSYNLAQISGTYSSTGDTAITFDVANGDQNTAIMTVVRPFEAKLSATTIKGTASPSATPGANTLTDVAIFTTANTTIKSDAVTLQTNAGVALVGSAVSYNRVYGQWEQDGPVTPVAANTSYVFPIGTAIDTNIASVVSTSRITPGAAGKYNLQFSLQWANADNQEHTFYVWLRKNGVNVANSTGDITCLKSAKGVSGWNYIVSSANATDYFELAYQVNNTSITFPYVAAQGTAPNDVPSAPALITTLTPIGA
jgi:hypothetical protein